MLKIGFNARLFPNNWRPAVQEIQFVAENGFDCLQFMSRNRPVTAEHLGNTLSEVQAALQAQGVFATLEIFAHLQADGRLKSGLTVLELLQANLPLITTLPCTHVHYHFATSHSAPAEVVRQLEADLVPQVEAALTIARQVGFRLGFEHNADTASHLFATPESCVRLLECLPELGLVWDFNHTRIEQIAAFKQLIPRMMLLHVSDTPLPDINHHLPLGLGSIDLADYCQALRAGGFDGPAILEIGGLPKSGGYGRDADAALLDSRQRLRAVEA